MSLGGYKFAGRFCQKGSLTDAEWTRLSHQTKVAAFMAASNAAGAGWDYYMEGSPDGVCHCIDEGAPGNNNFVTCFHNDRTGTWFAIYTLGAFVRYSSTVVDGAVRVELDDNTPTSSTTSYVGVRCSYFVRIATVPITYNRSLSSTPSFMTMLYPVGNAGIYSTMSTLSPYGRTMTYLADSRGYYGFAIKDDNIIIFSGSQNTSGHIHVSVASGHAFSSFVNSNDTCGCLFWNMQTAGTYNENDTYEYYSAKRESGTGGILAEILVCMGYSGNKVSLSTPGVCAIPMAYFATGTIPSYPYQSMCVYNMYNNETFVYGKGMINVSFLAANFHVQGTVPSAVFQVVANGNYLCLRSTANNASTPYSYKSFNNRATSIPSFAWYCGWDPSNPTITDASAWTEYTGT